MGIVNPYGPRTPAVSAAPLPAPTFGSLARRWLPLTHHHGLSGQSGSDQGMLKRELICPKDGFAASDPAASYSRLP